MCGSHVAFLGEVTATPTDEECTLLDALCGPEASLVQKAPFSPHCATGVRRFRQKSQQSSLYKLTGCH